MTQRCCTQQGTGSHPQPLITIVFGTRPEAVKLAPVARVLSEVAQVRLVSTGQHEDMLDVLLQDLEIDPDVRLRVMRPRQRLNDLAARLMGSLSSEITSHRPDAIIVQGDTTSALCGAMAGFHEKVPVAHVEAGLRSYDRANPFPEEANRRAIGQFATWHFAPTLQARQNLLKEGHEGAYVQVTGNTVVDSLLWVRQRGLGRSAFTGERTHKLLVTLHRRETQGSAMAALSGALGLVARKFDLEIVLPLHRSPTVRESILPVLGDERNVRLLEPLNYVDFVATLADATIAVTDSGGVQEEAPSLGVPVLVVRRTTERPEAIRANCAQLIGTDPAALVASLEHLLSERELDRSLYPRENPFGDGRASSRIAERLVRDLNEGERSVTALGRQPCASI